MQPVGSAASGLLYRIGVAKEPEEEEGGWCAETREAAAASTAAKEHASTNALLFVSALSAWAAIVVPQPTKARPHRCDPSDVESERCRGRCGHWW